MKEYTKNEKDEFIKETFEILFGEDSTPSRESDEIRKYTFVEAIELLKEMNDIYEQFLIDEHNR